MPHEGFGAGLEGPGGFLWDNIGWSVSPLACVFCVVLLVVCRERSILLWSTGRFRLLDLSGHLAAAFALTDDVFQRSGRSSAEGSSCVPA